MLIMLYNSQESFLHIKKTNASSRSSPLRCPYLFLQDFSSQDAPLLVSPLTILHLRYYCAEIFCLFTIGIIVVFPCVFLCVRFKRIQDYTCTYENKMHRGREFSRVKRISIASSSVRAYLSPLRFISTSIYVCFVLCHVGRGPPPVRTCLLFMYQHTHTHTQDESDSFFDRFSLIYVPLLLSIPCPCMFVCIVYAGNIRKI